MDGNKETQTAGKYLKKHLEPSQQEKPVNPILRNTNNNYLERFLDSKRISTSFFTFNGDFTSIDTNTFVDGIIENQRIRLIQEGKSTTEIAAQSIGRKLALEMRLGEFKKILL